MYRRPIDPTDHDKLYNHILKTCKRIFNKTIKVDDNDFFREDYSKLSLDNCQQTELLKYVIFNRYTFEIICQDWVPTVEQLIDVLNSFKLNNISLPNNLIDDKLLSFKPIPTDLINAFVAVTELPTISKYIPLSNINQSTMVAACMNRVTSRLIFDLHMAGVAYSSESLLAASEQHNVRIIKEHIDANITPTAVHLEAWIKSPGTVEIFFKYVTPSVDLIDSAILNSHDMVIAEILKQNPHPFTNSSLSAAIQSEKESIDLIKQIIQDVHPQQEHMLLACRVHKFNIIELLESYRLSLGDSEFNAFFRDFTYDKKSSCHVCSPFNRCKSCENKRLAMSNSTIHLDWFVSHGYELKIDDVAMLARRDIKVPDIERFGFVFNDDFLLQLAELGWWPYDLPRKQELFGTMCKWGSVDEIERWIEAGCKVNNDCLYDACVRQDVNLIWLLLDHVEPDVRCMRKLKQLNFDAFLSY